MPKSLSGGAGSEAAMITFRGISESSLYEAYDRAITVIAEERRFELRMSRMTVEAPALFHFTSIETSVVEPLT